MVVFTLIYKIQSVYFFIVLYNKWYKSWTKLAVITRHIVISTLDVVYHNNAFFYLLNILVR